MNFKQFAHKQLLAVLSVAINQLIDQIKICSDPMESDVAKEKGQKSLKQAQDQLKEIAEELQRACEAYHSGSKMV